MPSSARLHDLKFTFAAVGADGSVRPLLRFCAALLDGPYKYYFRNLQILCVVEYYPFNVCFAFISASRSA